MDRIYLTLGALGAATVIGLPQVWGSGGVSALREAEESLAKSRNQYFEALMEGRGKSSEERSRLKQEILQPAKGQVSRVLREQNSAFIQKNAKIVPRGTMERELAVEEKSALGPEFGKVWEMDKESPATQDSPDTSLSGSKATVPRPVKQSQDGLETVVVDPNDRGSVNEIEFPGPAVPAQR